MDKLQLMQVFTRVADGGSFTNAAETLGLSRAAVSIAVQQLEAHLGVRLLHRTTRRVHLTEEGAAFHERCLRILSEVDEAEQLFQASSRIAGRLSISVPTRIARRVIVPALPQLLARYPGLEIQLGASDRSINLVEKGVDAVVRVGALPDSSLVAKPLGSLAQVNCASQSYIARFGLPASLDDLDRHVVVKYSPSFGGAAEWDYVERGHERSRPMRSAVTVDNAETYIASGLAGLGLIQIPAYDVGHYLESGELIAVLPKHVPLPLPLSIVYPNRKYLPTRVRAFTEWVTDLFERHGMTTPTRTSDRRKPA